jgi:hypothetical protein
MVAWTQWEFFHSICREAILRTVQVLIRSSLGIVTRFGLNAKQDGLHRAIAAMAVTLVLLVVGPVH